MDESKRFQLANLMVEYYNYAEKCDETDEWPGADIGDRTEYMNIIDEILFPLNWEIKNFDDAYNFREPLKIGKASLTNEVKK